MSILVTLGSILVLAAATEALVEYLVQPVIKPDSMPTPDGGVDVRGMILRYVAAAVGVGLCLVYNADLLALAELHASIPVIGPIVTGLLIGRGANFINDFADKWLSAKRS